MDKFWIEQTEDAGDGNTLFVVECFGERRCRRYRDHLMNAGIVPQAIEFIEVVEQEVDYEGTLTHDELWCVVVVLPGTVEDNYDRLHDTLAAADRPPVRQPVAIYLDGRLAGRL
jgi:hypothetical protein